MTKRKKRPTFAFSIFLAISTAAGVVGCKHADESSMESSNTSDINKDLQKITVPWSEANSGMPLAICESTIKNVTWKLSLDRGPTERPCDAYLVPSDNSTVAFMYCVPVEGAGKKARQGQELELWSCNDNSHQGQKPAFVATIYSKRLNGVLSVFADVTGKRENIALKELPCKPAP